MKRSAVFGAVLVLLVATGARAFDGQRKGFVLGGGVGFAPLASWQADIPVFNATVPADEQKSGFGVQFIIGGAFDERNMLVYEGQVVGYNSDIAGWSVVQGFNGAAWYHYYGSTGRSFFTTVGLGLYYFKVEDFAGNDPGGALLLGIGFEFAKHWQLGLSLAVGRTTWGGVDIDHAHINLLISGIAF
jgi:hypothetical protein